jgi:hypothetical protein
MDSSFRSQLEGSDSILILLPDKPFFDQAAAGLSLYLSLRGKKEVAIHCPTPIRVEFNRLVGVNKITQEIGNKNLVLSFSDYRATDIERVSYDIEDSQFKLTVIPKQGVASPKKDQVFVGYSGVSANTVILVGGVNESHFPVLSSKDLVGARLMHVGNRVFNSPQGKAVMSFAKAAPSVSEVVTRLLKENDFDIDADIATNLILGIEEGSDRFAAPEVTAETFETFAYLLRAGGQRGMREKAAVRSPFMPVPGSIPSARSGMPPQEDINVAEFEKKEVSSSSNPPSDWLAQPKVYKGTSIS